MTAEDTVNRVYREFKRYTGDGHPGEPLNAPLPVGDPQSGPHNPKKSELRQALLAPIVESRQELEVIKADTLAKASVFTGRAEDAAEAAETARDEALSAVGEATGRALVYPDEPEQIFDAGGRRIGSVAAGQAPGDVAIVGQLHSEISARVPRTLKPRVVDFHFGCARGVGFTSGVDGGTKAYNVAAPAAKGASSFTYSGTALSGGTLIVLRGADGEHYTATVQSAASGTCVLRHPLPCALQTGQNVWSFWNDDAHPNAKGFDAIADHALRQDMGLWTKVYQGDPVSHNGGAVAAGVANNPFNVGSATSGYGWNITPSGATSGCKWSWEAPATGMYRLVFQCSKDNGPADVLISVFQGANSLGQYVVKTNDAGRHELDIRVPSSAAVEIFATRGSDLFIISDMVVLQQDGDAIPSLNWGRHVILGDSWVTLAAGGLEAALADRLDRAVVVGKGAGGNTAAQALARFDTDVAPENPDVVWVVVSTNDIAQGVSASTFANNLSAIAAKCAGVGAIPIFFTPFTGPTNEPTWIDRGRAYYASVPFYEETRGVRTGASGKTVTRHSVFANVPASATAAVLSLGLRTGTYRVLSYYLSHSTVLKGGSLQPASGGDTLLSLAADWITTPEAFTVTTKFVQLLRTAGGDAEVVQGWIEIED